MPRSTYNPIWENLPSNSPNSRCSLCPSTHRCVQSDCGPQALNQPRQLMFIGEAPGHDEDSNTGRPFTGQAGREFNQKYLPLAYLTRDDIYLTNTVKCRPEANKTPGTALINSCSAAFLDCEFQLFQPSILVPMGAVALSWVSTRMEEAERYSSLPGNEFPRPLNILLQHGIPFKVKILGMETTVFPMYHPALGLHDGKAIFHLRRDFQKLGEFIKEQSGLYRDLSTEEGRRLWDMVQHVGANPTA